MKPVLILSAVAVVLVGLAGWERSSWIRQKGAQYAAAARLIGDAATKRQVVDALGEASDSDKTTDIGRRLHDRDRLLVYSRANSIMFLSTDHDGRASHASCFLQ